MNRAKTALPDWSKGSDFLQLDVREAPPGGLADWLAGQLRAAIADGRLPIGARLPASRVLAAELRVSRGVVTEAYQRLIDDGHAAGRGRAGTVVVAAPVLPPEPEPDRSPAKVITALPGVAVFDAVRAAPARIDLTPGVPDLTAFPRAAWLRAERAVLDELEPAHFGYGDPRGAPAMRVAVSHWLARNRGIRADPGEIIVVAGVAQALTLVGEVLRQHGLSEIAVEDPSSLGARQHLHHCGLATPPVPVDDDGLLVSELRAPAVLLTPAHQFPMGVVLGGERRRELMRWVAGGGIVVEDDYDAEHRYDRAPVPAVRSMVPEVCYTGSVSKLLAPALRVGWLLAPPRFRDDLVAAKRFADLGNPVLAQLVLARLMETGELERQLRVVRARHRRRRDAMIRALASEVPSAVVHGAAAGLHLTITFDAEVDDVELAATALAEGVKVQPLSWHRQRPGRPGLVLGYAARTATEIVEGVAVLGRLVGASP
ncbi:PLP-dependent aminotransferase family protein [Amycolatopsis sp. A133]|uniref:MocR-like pyridoxine biosynthesis transcription factor PdxR n=1 Tax=Amycolatopsis sp. A133 TaxID=3064472 RepID=UPI0027EF0A81|nr:PLP-dependent aminotransferase family protein [Amycolatopsis sp. A133]MDQ7804266.1 PLP-dependent aminotransferase family protein [Amycolatopsis sp. A133]